MSNTKVYIIISFQINIQNINILTYHYVSTKCVHTDHILKLYLMHLFSYIVLNNTSLTYANSIQSIIYSLILKYNYYDTLINL
jgi:hypothetical protein